MAQCLASRPIAKHGHPKNHTNPFERTAPPPSCPLVTSRKMVVIETTRVLMRRLAPKHRRILTSRSRTDVHLKLKRTRVYHKLTPAEKMAQGKKRAERRKRLNDRLKDCDATIWSLAVGLATDFGYNAHHWYHRMMQNARIAKSERKVSRWNAFVALTLEAINAVLPEGVPKKKASDPDIAPKLKAAWEAMSVEERNAFTDARVQEMTEAREVKDVMKHDSTISAFHDVRTSLLTMENMVKDLYLRTGLEVLLFAVRSDQEQYNRPFVLSTSEKGTDFFNTCFNQLPSAWVTRFESYCLLGIEGLKTSQAAEMSRLKSACSSLILDQVRHVAAPTLIPKMHYQDFHEQMTERHHIICENWPLPSFCTPHKLGLVELRTLYDRLSNVDAPPLFRVLTDAEWRLYRRSTQPLPVKSVTITLPGVFDDIHIPSQHPSNRDSATTSSSTPNTASPTPPSTTPPTSFVSTTSFSSPPIVTSAAPIITPNARVRKPRKQRSDKGVKRKACPSTTTPAATPGTSPSPPTIVPAAAPAAAIPTIPTATHQRPQPRKLRRDKGVPSSRTRQVEPVEGAIGQPQVTGASPTMSSPGTPPSRTFGTSSTINASLPPTPSSFSSGSTASFAGSMSLGGIVPPAGGAVSTTTQGPVMGGSYHQWAL
ncbi:hypothetical protein QCA50_011182 [Cerrena zonata]|uniref:HMG box domain-containing protein n=1 Tax=Cerrena zonata TaxID=2478898 RepID=A0AAW0FY27_9APHY